MKLYQFAIPENLIACENCHSFVNSLSPVCHARKTGENLATRVCKTIMQSHQIQQLTSSLGLHINTGTFDTIVLSFGIHFVRQYYLNAAWDAGLAGQIKLKSSLIACQNCKYFFLIFNIVWWYVNNYLIKFKWNHSFGYSSKHVFVSIMIHRKILVTRGQWKGTMKSCKISWHFD